MTRNRFKSEIAEEARIRATQKMAMSFIILFAFLAVVCFMFYFASEGI